MDGRISYSPIYKLCTPSGSYVYIHRRATDSTPFYVGKGTGKRAWTSWDRSAHWLNVAKKNNVIIEIVRDGLSDEKAFDLEVETIKSIKENHLLVNYTIGGEAPPRDTAKMFMRPVDCSNGMKFNSVKSAAIWCSKNGYPLAKGAKISVCCAGGSKSAYGLDWRYYGDHKVLDYKKPINTPKMATCSNGMVFDSLSGTVTWLKSEGFSKATHSAIGRAQRTGQLAYGYTWS